MNVTQLIDSLVRFVFTRSDPDAEDRADLLLFLNLANEKAYSVTKNSSRLSKYLKIYLDGDFTAQLPNNFFFSFQSADGFLQTYSEKKIPFDKLQQSSYRIIDNKIELTKSVRPFVDQVPLIDAGRPYILAIIRPDLKKLVENINDINTETDTPIYPMEFHLGLVQGAAYFMFLSQFGHADKIKYADRDWSEFLKNLGQYYIQDV